MYDAETVQWIAVATTQDELGNETGGGPTGPRDVKALVAGRGSSENVGGRTPDVLVGKTLYLLDTTIEPGPSDQFIVRGQTYDVEGEPHRWGSSGVEVAITRTGARP